MSMVGIVLTGENEMLTNAANAAAKLADAAFTNFDCACHWHGEKSDEAREAKALYEMAMARYQRAVAIENEVRA
jgi:hypothetical protein